jgi:hypothetical protein
MYVISVAFFVISGIMMCLAGRSVPLLMLAAAEVLPVPITQVSVRTLSCSSIDEHRDRAASQTTVSFFASNQLE